MVPRAAGAGCLSAAVAVRDLVPVAGPHERTPDPDARGRRGGVRGDRVSDPVLQALADELRAEGGLIGAVTSAQPEGRADLGAAVAGPRTAAQPDRYALLVEAIREGYLQHYGASRVLDTSHDPDLGLLA